MSATNPRYFAVRTPEGEERAVYLTGSHVNNNFGDGTGPGSECVDPPETNDFAAYLEFLTAHDHNFVRLWRWEHFRSQAAGGAFHLCMSPQPWPRVGPASASDGKPRFDLSRSDDAFFDRLRKYIVAAGEAGIYVAVMLFEGWGLHLSPAPDQVEGHPAFADNNVNGIAMTSINDWQVLPLADDIRSVQESYIRAVVDAVHDLPNVLFEVANESCGGGAIDQEFADVLGLATVPDWGDSTEWHYWVIDTLKRHEEERGYDPHPIGMTMQFPVVDQTKVNDPLFASRADWVSPGFDDAIFKDGPPPMAPGSPPSRWFDDPPANDGAKVVLSDTDHYSPMECDALWAWRSFLRGHHPLLYDLGIIQGVDPPDPTLEPARLAMGDTLRLARQVDLIAMTPRGDLASSGYALADPGREYVVLQADATTSPFSVTLDAGRYTVEWFGVDSRESVASDPMEVAVTGEPVAFTPPFGVPQPAVLHLASEVT